MIFFLIAARLPATSLLWGGPAARPSPFYLVAADLLNDRVLPFFEEHEIPLLRVLTDRGTEYCGQREHHEYELYLAVENIDHSRTKARHQKNPNDVTARELAEDIS